MVAGFQVSTGGRFWVSTEALKSSRAVEPHYSAAAFILSERAADGSYTEPSKDLAIEPCLKAFYGHLIGCL